MSFIIPVYNVECYLRECVESIILQNMNGCEIILVDDGSTDTSGSICDELSKNKEYISVVHQENGGLAAARNTGLMHAKGDYIAFVDSDDRIAPGSVNEIISWTKFGGADLCFMEGIKFYPNGWQEPIGDGINKNEVQGKSKEEVLYHLATRSKFAGSACTKIYRKAFLDDNHLHFPKDRRISEDLGFCRDCILNAKSYDALEIPFYEYRQNRQGSITDMITMKSFQGLQMFVVESVEKLTKNKIAIDEVAACAMSFAAYEYCIMLWQYSRLPAEEKARALAFLREYAWVLKYGKSRKTKGIHAAQRLLGIKNVAVLLDKYMRMRKKKELRKA